MSQVRVRTHTNPFNFHKKMDPLDFSERFENFSGKLDLEIGFGKGGFLQHWASLNPQRHIIGAEIRQAIVDQVKKSVEKKNLKNIHLLHNSAERILEDIIPDHSLEHVFVFHPDPWLKKSHHKRRFIRENIIDLLLKKMRTCAKLYISTDVASLWNDIKETLDLSPLKGIEDPTFWQEVYTSHWDAFSIKDKRTRFYSTWQKVSN